MQTEPLQTAANHLQVIGSKCLSYLSLEPGEEQKRKAIARSIATRAEVAQKELGQQPTTLVISRVFTNRDRTTAVQRVLACCSQGLAAIQAGEGIVETLVGEVFFEAHYVGVMHA